MKPKAPKVGADDFVSAGLGEDALGALPREGLVHTLERHGDEFLVSWPEHKITCALTAVHENGDGVHAELAVSHDGVDLHWGRLGLSSTQAREGVVKKLTSILPDLPWRGILEATCRRTAEAMRERVPTVLLDARLRIGPRKLVEPVVEAAGLTVLFADGGAGKGYVSLVFAIAAATGDPMPGGIRPSRKVPVLYLDWESSRPDLEHRLALLGQGLGVDTRNLIHYRHLWRPLGDEIATVRTELARLSIGLVIIDSLGPACGADPESADSVIRAISAMRSLDAPCLAIAHVSKMMADQKGSKTRPFGSVFVWNLARSCWEVKRSEDGDTGAELMLGLYNPKVNEGPRRPPFGLRFIFDPPGDDATSVSLEAYPLSAAPDLAAKLPLRQRIRSLLATGALTTDEIVEATGAPEGQVAARLRELSRKHIVVKLDSGGGRGNQAKWGLAAS